MNAQTLDVSRECGGSITIVLRHSQKKMGNGIAPMNVGRVVDRHIVCADRTALNHQFYVVWGISAVGQNISPFMYWTPNEW